MTEIPGFSGYKINESGVIFSRWKNWKEMVQTIHSEYLGCAIINDNGIRINARTHRLVAMVFIPNPENKPCVNHIDGNKLNNHYSNLEWCTVKENSRHAADNGLYNIMRGARNYQSKPVLDIKTGIKYETIRAAARSINMDRTDLSKRLKGIYTNKTNFVFA